MPPTIDWPGFRRLLLRWYRRNRRDLPWRAGGDRRPDPYHVLVSEAMLQQTQVATVVGYYRRFLDAFPTVERLSAADESRVLGLWQGLGYYRRARALHAAAGKMVREHGGRVPASVEALMQLPGVGRYTAGAVASIAYGVAAPVVDGNVGRVMCRVVGERRAADHRDVTGEHWRIMGELVRGRQNPGDVNQAVMELGAMVCTPRSPRCPACPVRDACRGRVLGDPERLGAKSKRAAPVEVVHRVVAVHRRGRWLFERRDGEGLWGGMWQLVTLEGTTEGRVPELVRQRTGVRLDGLARLDGFTHRTTHRTIRFEVYRACGSQGRPKRGVWRRLDSLDDLPISNAQKRVVEIVRGGSAPLPCD